MGDRGQTATSVLPVPVAISIIADGRSGANRNRMKRLSIDGCIIADGRSGANRNASTRGLSGSPIIADGRSGANRNCVQHQGNRILLSESEYRSQILQIPARPLPLRLHADFSDFSPFAGFSASRRSVDMFSAACPTLITLPSSPNGAPASS